MQPVEIRSTRRLILRVRAVLMAAAGLLAAFAAPSQASGAAAIDAAVAARLRTLDCSHVSAADVRDVLSRAPAPRIMLLQGSVPLVTMEPFARFLIAMGYPADRLRNPRDGALSYSSFVDSARLAGSLAYDYEQSGMEPMLIGHSQGGMLAIRTLYEFAGAFHESLDVVDPATGASLARTSILDPHTHHFRPVVGLRVSYAAAIATGWLPRVFLGQWDMIRRLRAVPDTVGEFTGFSLPNDAIAGNAMGDTPYKALGRASVRNVVLPGSYHHVTLPRADHLADDPALRRWIDAWTPGTAQASPAGDTENLVHATDIWYSVKRNWCAQAQGLLNVPAS